MSPCTTTIQRLCAACLLGASLALPAAAVEPEVELRCEFRATRAGLAAADARRLRDASAADLRDEIADELAARLRAERSELARGPVAIPAAATAR